MFYINKDIKKFIFVINIYMIINNHILNISNIYYFNKMFYINNINNNIKHFIDNYKQQDISFCINLEKCVIIENMLVINTIHSCYAASISGAAC